MITSAILSTATVALIFSAPPTTAPSSTVEQTLKLSEAQERSLYRVCNNSPADQVNRCRARQLARYKLSPNTPVLYKEDELSIYRTRAQGNNFLWKRLQQKRTTEVTTETARTRRTFLEDPTQSQPESHQRRDYINDIREERLQCMLKPPGRQRSMCLDELGNTARTIMRATVTPYVPSN